MHRVFAASALGIALLLSSTACGGVPADPNSAEIPAASSDMAGENYKDVVGHLEDAGFTNVGKKSIPDLVTGWLTKDGEVENVSVNGRTEFDDGDRFPKDAKIVVSYHTFPSDDDKPSDQPSNQPTEGSTVTGSAKPEILTANNNADLAAILALGDNCSPSMAQFATKYAAKTIQFDGSVQNVAPHGGYDTRFDFLVGPGDFNPNSASGPTFQFADKNIYDMNVTGRQSGRLGTGDNATFTAEVGDYSRQTCLFQLEPVETHKG